MIRTLPDYSLETALLNDGHLRVAGVDEVGRGPWAGPVVAAAVILDASRIPAGLDDSKRLGGRRREALARLVHAGAEVSFGQASVDEIDSMNILRASHLAMVRALRGLRPPVCIALIDGNAMPRDLPCPARTVIGGDGISVSIAAASVVAKVRRDALMVALAQQHPGYGWDTNAGYGTAAHRAALHAIGVTPHHRRSFRPVHNILYQEN